MSASWQLAVGSWAWAVGSGQEQAWHVLATSGNTCPAPLLSLPLPTSRKELLNPAPSRDTSTLCALTTSCEPVTPSPRVRRSVDCQIVRYASHPPPSRAARLPTSAD